MKILLVEDEKLLSDVITKGLKKLSYAVDTAYDGEQALELLEINSYDLAILDLNLPKINGLEVLRRIRKTDNKLKIIILSARNNIEDKIKGLDLGANDYLEKPFDFGELVARINNLLRWSFIQIGSIITYKKIEIDTSRKEVSISGNPVELTNKEYGILEYLAYNKDRIISAEELIEHVWDSDADMFSNSFKFHIHSLRKKLSLPNIIKNIRGQGYTLNMEDESEK